MSNKRSLLRRYWRVLLLAGLLLLAAISGSTLGYQLVAVERNAELVRMVSGHNESLHGQRIQNLVSHHHPAKSFAR